MFWRLIFKMATRWKYNIFPKQPPGFERNLNDVSTSFDSVRGDRCHGNRYLAVKRNAFLPLVEHISQRNALYLHSPRMNENLCRACWVRRNDPIYSESLQTPPLRRKCYSSLSLQPHEKRARYRAWKPVQFCGFVSCARQVTGRVQSDSIVMGSAWCADGWATGSSIPRHSLALDDVLPCQ